MTPGTALNEDFEGGFLLFGWMMVFFKARRISRMDSENMADVVFGSRWMSKLLFRSDAWSIFLLSAVFLAARVMRGDEIDELGTDTK